MKPLRILTYVPVWQRREITRYCYDSLIRTYRIAPKELSFETLIVASTDEDEALAKQYGFEVFRTPNQPLGRKFNAGLLHALEAFTFDYIFQINSDDVLSSDCWQLFAPHLKLVRPFFGVDRVYFYDTSSRNMLMFQYSTGCGIRFIRRNVIEESGFVERDGEEGEEVFELWADEAISGLDTASEINIMQRGNYAQMLIRNTPRQKPVVCDIKSDVNIHLFSEFRLAGSKPNEAQRKQIMIRFPELKELDYALSTQTTKTA